MKPLISAALFRQRPGTRGVALVITLMMMSILVMMVVGLAAVMRSEQAAARNLTYQVLAEQMADLGAKQAMALVLSNSTGGLGRPTASGPGWMITNGVTVVLCSSNTNGPIKNLDEIGTNSLILSLPDGVRGNVPASWSNVTVPGSAANVPPIGRFAWWVDDEGTKVNLNAVGSNNTNLYLPLLTNFPVSAAWIFRDPVALTNNNASSNRAIMVRQRLGPLPTTESVKDESMVPEVGRDNIGNSTYRQTKGHITVWSSNLDLTPWGASKINLADPSVTSAQIKAALNTNAWTNFFGPNMTLARKYGGGQPGSTNAGAFGDYVMDQIVANLQAARTNWAPPSTNSLPYTPNDSKRHRAQMPTNAVGWPINAPMLNEVAVSVSYSVTPPNVVCRFVVASEIWNPWPVNAAGYQLEIRPRKFRFFIAATPQPSLPTNGVIVTSTPSTPNPGANVVYSQSDPGTGLIGALPGCWVGHMLENVPSAGQNPYPIAGVSTNLPTLNGNSLTVITNTFSYIVTFTNTSTVPSSVSDAYVQLDRVVLRDSAGRALDWVTLDDFAQDQNFGSTNTSLASDYGQLNFSIAYPFPGGRSILVSPANSTNFTPAAAMGLAKNDPRVRLPLQAWNTAAGSQRGQINTGGFFPANLQAWKRVGPVGGTVAPAVSIGSTNSAGVFDCTSTNGTVTGISYLWPDPVAAGTTQTNHPHFVPGFVPINGIRSVAQLGAIHTGLPWRTLRLQFTPSNELAQGPPDWILLDVFTATNPNAPRAMVNVNGLPRAWGGPVTNTNGTISTRVLALLSAMGTAGSQLSSSTTNLAISNGVPVSLARANGYTNLEALGTNLARAMANFSAPGAWASGSGWGNYRLANSNRFSTNGLFLTGEILELAGMTQETNLPATSAFIGGEDFIEGRLRSFMDLITTRSDTFTVWSAGQGLVVVTNRTPFRTNVMAEVRKQTVFQRVPVFVTNTAVTPPTTNLNGYRLQVLYSRNHVVE